MIEEGTITTQYLLSANTFVELFHFLRWLSHSLQVRVIQHQIGHRVQGTVTVMMSAEDNIVSVVYRMREMRK